MFKKVDRETNRVKKHGRIRNRIEGTTERPRLCVYRSLNNIFVQIVDDSKGITLVSASTIDKEIKPEVTSAANIEAAKLIGKKIAERAKKVGISKVVFDRSGYLYTGRVKALADAAREAGLEF